MTCQPPPVSYADSHSVGDLHEPLRSIVNTLIIRAPKPLSLVSGTRTPYQQWILRHDRCPGHECGPMSQYPGHPRTALVGQSHHENTSATKCAADLGGPGLGWVHTVADEYGIHFPVPGENWHVEPIPGRVPTVSLIQWGAPATHPTGRHSWQGFGDGATDRTVYLAGGEEHEVLELQLRLTAAARQWQAPELDPHGADGVYGHDTQVAVNNFKKRVIAMQRAEGMAVWANADSFVGQATINMLRFLNP